MLNLKFKISNPGTAGEPTHARYAPVLPTSPTPHLPFSPAPHLPTSSALRRATSPPPSGVTLIELLVVISVIAIMTAIMIPRLRLVNSDRNIREAARVTGSVFASASNRAGIDGIAGVLIERHPNLIDKDASSNNRNFAATTLYVMRAVPPYAGDDTDSKATTSGGPTIQIDTPLEHTTTDPLIQVNDTISLNHGSARYLITNVGAPSGGKITLTLGGGGYLPSPAASATGVPFVVYRQPKKLESSRVELPEGYIVDLRYSGSQSTTLDHTTTEPIYLIYNGSGAVDRIYYHDGTSQQSAVVDGTLYWLVTPYDFEGTTDPLLQGENLWVTVAATTGGVNIAYNVPAVTLIEARDIAQGQTSANQ